MPKLREFAIEIFVYGIKALLQLLLRQLAHGVVRRVVVDVREEDGLRERGLDVLARAAVAVAACANLRESLSVRCAACQSAGYSLCSRTSS